MDLEWIESFRVFAETLNFTHTARRRHLTQPAVFRHIQNLGEDLGVPLYRKVGRNLHLTAAGTRLARFSREVPDRLAVMVSEVRGDDSQPVVSLSAGQGAFLYLLGRAIRKFTRSDHGRVKLSVRDAAGALSDVRDGTAHLAVTVLASLPSDLECAPIYELAPHLVVPSDHRFAARKSLRLRDLAGEPLVVPSRGRPMRTDLESRFASEGIDLNVALEADGWALIMSFVSLGLGCAIVNGCCEPPKGVTAVRLRGLPKSRYYVLRARDGYRFAAEETLRKRLVTETKELRFFDT